MAAIYLRRGVVLSVDENEDDLTVVTVGLWSNPDCPDDHSSTIKACTYPGIAAIPRPGDLVVVNTLGVELGLGTGGLGFILANLSAPLPQRGSAGHIVKLRYTPLQLSVLSVEEEASPFHDRLKATGLSLSGAPVVSSELHSALPAIAAGVKAYDASLSICYIMTDGGALPMAFSQAVRSLKRHGMIQSTVTVGHAFGGDYEAVNMFSGLIAARHVARADVIIVSKGPGIVGTGTPLGHTGMEQGEALNAAYRLGGVTVLTPRVSEAEDRERHRGVSHHFEEILKNCIYCPAYVPVPEEFPAIGSMLASTLATLGVADQHRVVESPGEPGLRLLEQTGIAVSTMGRSLGEERAYFAAAAASGWFASRVVREDRQLLPAPGKCWSPKGAMY